VACGAALDRPADVDAPVAPQNAPRERVARWWHHRNAAAAAIALSACAIGSLAIYLIHRTAPALPPGFERGTSVEVAETRGMENLIADRSEPAEPETPTALAPNPAPDPAQAPAPAPAAAAAAPAAQAPDPAPPGAAMTRRQFRPPASPVGPQAATSASQTPRAQERGLAAIQQAQCAEATMLGRVVCNERVRLRYCRERWNAHPDCVVAAPPDPVR
jgi:hypothetical protein